MFWPLAFLDKARCPSSEMQPRGLAALMDASIRSGYAESLVIMPRLSRFVSAKKEPRNPCGAEVSLGSWGDPGSNAIGGLRKKRLYFSCDSTIMPLPAGGRGRRGCECEAECRPSAIRSSSRLQTLHVMHRGFANFANQNARPQTFFGGNAFRFHIGNDHTFIALVGIGGIAGRGRSPSIPNHRQLNSESVDFALLCSSVSSSSFMPYFSGIAFTVTFRVIVLPSRRTSKGCGLFELSLFDQFRQLARVVYGLAGKLFNDVVFLQLGVGSG